MYSTFSIKWPLMTLWHKKLEHQQQWYRHTYFGMFRFKHYKDKMLLHCRLSWCSCDVGHIELFRNISCNDKIKQMMVSIILFHTSNKRVHHSPLMINTFDPSTPQTTHVIVKATIIIVVCQDTLVTFLEPHYKQLWGPLLLWDQGRCMLVQSTLFIMVRSAP